jgi:UDP-glucose:(heptosyl)LPS alpha-1,3-glucosyltransferase
MKICIVTRKFSLTWGGVERVAATLAGGLAAQGHELQVLTSFSDLSIPGVSVTLLKLCSLFPPLKIVLFQQKVKKALRYQTFDIIYGLSRVTPVDIYRLSDGIHAYWMEIRYPDNLLRLIKYCTSPVHCMVRRLEEQILFGDRQRVFVTNSVFIKDKIIEYYSIPAERIEVIYNGVDHQIFNPEVKTHRKRMRDDRGIAEDALVLLFVANDWERKGLSTIIRAAATAGIPGLKLVIVGRGKKTTYLSLAEQLNIGPDTLVFEDHADRVEQYYGMADIFVLPTRYDPFANVCLEAMACGLPCITTKTNGAAELIEPGENGFVLNSWDDARGLADVIVQLNSRDQRTIMGEKANGTARHYSWERHVDETLRLFRRVYENKHSTAALS